jgi:DNA mismatch repair ATPase MutS
MDYEASLRYSVGFAGYIDLVDGVARGAKNGFLGKARFNVLNASGEAIDTKFVGQYYPTHKHSGTVVQNSVDLSANLIITGVNASGKTTILKSTTINIIFTQQFGCGFYTYCSLNPYTHIHSYLNIPDTSERDSLFQAESRRCKEIIDIIREHSSDTSRHFCIFDELYSGTNPIEATKSAYAFLLYLSKYTHVDFILTTHYHSICKKLRHSKRIRNYKMEVNRDDNDSLVYTYKLKPGICNIQGAIEILKNMEYPEEILTTIREYTGDKI